MRCSCCNARLTDYEATRRHAMTEDFLDMCGECFGTVTSNAYIPYKDRPDLWNSEDTEDLTDFEGIDNTEDW